MGRKEKGHGPRLQQQEEDPKARLANREKPISKDVSDVSEFGHR